VVPESIMPAFDWMFKVVDQAPAGTTPVPLPKAYAPAKGVVVPAHRAEALVAYLLSLKQPALPDLAAHDGGSAMPGVSSPSPASVASTAANAPSAGPVPATGGGDLVKGKALFTANCAACHQANGEGLPGAFPSLKGDDVVNDADPTEQLHAVLHGLQGARVGGVVYSSPMPPFGAALSDADVANIVDYERSSWGNHGAPVTAEQVAALRAKGK
jgi:cytochrome c oxidase cbb3-type subunit 2